MHVLGVSVQLLQMELRQCLLHQMQLVVGWSRFVLAAAPGATAQTERFAVTGCVFLRIGPSGSPPMHGIQLTDTSIVFNPASI